MEKIEAVPSIQIQRDKHRETGRQKERCAKRDSEVDIEAGDR